MNTRTKFGKASVLLLLVPLSFVLLGMKNCPSRQPTGNVELILVDPTGEPIPELTILLDGTEKSSTSDNYGLARFERVPAGIQTFSVVKNVPAREGIEAEFEFITLEAFIEVVVEPDGTVRITVKIVILIPPIPPVPVPAECKSRPWCGAASSMQGPNGNPIVSIGGGVHGNCPCTTTLPGGKCPGKVVTRNAPMGNYAVTTTTCLGGVECELPKKAVSCDVTLP